MFSSNTTYIPARPGESRETEANIEKMKSDLHKVRAMYMSFAKGILEDNPRNTFDHINWSERAEGIQYAISYLNYLIKNQEK